MSYRYAHGFVGESAAVASSAKPSSKDNTVQGLRSDGVEARANLGMPITLTKMLTLGLEPGIQNTGIHHSTPLSVHRCEYDGKLGV